MKILVTGGAGFIGSNVALELEKQGHDLTVLDNLHSGNKKNLEGFKGTFIQADITKPCDFKTKFDVIIHEAAITDPRHPNDEETYKHNVQGFKNVIERAKKWNATLVYASTAGLYGNGPVPMNEDQNKELLSVYGKSKLYMDTLAKEHFEKIRIVGLRYFNVFGPREHFKGRPASMIYHLGKQMKAGKNPRIFNFGEQIRDHVYVKDAVHATIQAMKAQESCIVNVGTGIPTSFNELVAALNEVMNTKLKPEYFEMPYDPKTYQSNTQAATEYAEKMISFKAQWSLKDGIKDYFAWLAKKGWYG